MNRFDFLYELRQGLRDFSEEDIMEHIVFYREMIEDRMEDGISEKDALAEIGTPQEVVAQIIAETPLPTLIKTKLKKERILNTWQIVLIVLGSPIWLSLLIAVLSVIFSVIVTVFVVIISLYAVAVTLAACGIAGVFATIPMLIINNGLSAFASLGLGLFCAGGATLMFIGCNGIAKAIAGLVKKLILWIKSRFVTKEAL